MSTKSQFPILNDAEWLRQQYVVRQRTAAEIAEEVGCHRESVTRALLRFGIQTVRRGPARYQKLKDREWLSAEMQVKPMRQIADEIGCSYSGVLHAVRKFRIPVPDRPTRRHSETRSENIKKALREKYPNGRTGADAANWRGGKARRSPAGYVQVYAPNHPRANNGRVFEHILVAEQTLGRSIGRDEVVHHINHVKDDNRPENLAVMNNGQHIAWHFDEPIVLMARIEYLEALLRQHGIEFDSP